MNEYRVQRLKEELTFAQQRNRHQKKQLANYKKVHEKDLKEIERLNNIIDKKEQLLGDNIKRLEREVVKRDNIINELDKFLNELKTDTENDIKYARSKNDDEEIIRLNREFNMIDMIFVKLQELKGSISNDYIK